MENNQANKIFQLIKNDKAQENHFFEVLGRSSNALPWLKLLMDRGYFSPKNNPSPVEVSTQKGYFTMPRWNVLDYLENVARLNASTPKEDVTSSIINIVDSITKYRNEAGERIDNYITDWVMVKIIFLLPTKYITEEHIEFVRTALMSRWGTASLVASELGNIAFKYLIKDAAKEILLNLLNVALDYNKSDTGIPEKYASIIDEYWLNDMLDTNKEGIARLCAIEAAEVALTKIHGILQDDEGQFNIAIITTIEDNTQMHSPNHYQYRLVRFVRDMYKLAKPNQLSDKVESLIVEKHPIFKRIAIYTVNEHYDELNKLFWQWNGNPLEEQGLKHELYELLKAKCKLFTQEQITQVLNWIETKKYFTRDAIKKDERERAIAYRKKEWLSAITNTQDKDVLSAYQKYDEIEPAQLDHPGFDFWMETRWGGNVSLIDKGELLKKTNSELARYLNDFKGTGKWKEPDEGDVSEAFRDCVKNCPEHYSTELDPFLNVARRYQYSLIWGLQEAWRANKNFPWDEILYFIKKLVTSDGFWNETPTPDKRHDFRPQIVSQIAELIEEGTKDDRHAFDGSLLPLAETILLTLGKETAFQIEEDNGFIYLALNSPRGQIYCSMVNYSLRCSRVRGKTTVTWENSIKQYFDGLLNIEKPPIELFVTLGLYLPNLNYLDKEWVNNNINKIFPTNNDTAWEGAFTGYLYSTNAVYSDLYKLLRQNGHYHKGLNTNFTDTHCTQRIVGHICVGYLENWESVEDNKSLISIIINEGSIDKISDIVNFFWTLRDDKNTKNIKTKIKPLWKNLIDVLLKQEQDIEIQKVISELARWLSLIDTMDEQITEWLIISARYIETNFNSLFLIEYLLPHASKTPEKVGQVFIAMLNAGIYPQYKKEHIQDIVRTLYAKKQKVIADMICNSYLAKGIDFLVAIYEENTVNK